jgi:thiol-disulfide isomerase/thioredoxin
MNRPIALIAAITLALSAACATADELSGQSQTGKPSGKKDFDKSTATLESLRERLQKLREPTPVPELPAEPENASENAEYQEKMMAIRTEYKAKEDPRLLELATTCEEILHRFPDISDRADIETEMATSDMRLLYSTAEGKNLAREQIGALLKKSTLSPEAAVILYDRQLMMFPSLSTDHATEYGIEEIVPVPKEESKKLDATKQLLAKFAAAYPNTKEYGWLLFTAADFGAKLGADEQQSDQWLTEAEKIGDVKLQQQVQGKRFRRAIIGRPVPEIEFTDLDGHKVSLAALRGKVVLLNFWATWCGPCVAAFPDLKKLYEKYRDHGFEVIAISLDSDRAALDAYLKRNPLPWPQYFDGKGWENRLAQQFGVTGIPEEWLIDREGIVVAIDNPASPTFKTKIEELLNTKQSPAQLD